MLVNETAGQNTVSVCSVFSVVNVFSEIAFTSTPIILRIRPPFSLVFARFHIKEFF